jgi:hypothetical protein
MRAGLTTLILEESATTMTCFPCRAIACAKAASYISILVEFIDLPTNMLA